jgi:hypothetical protein
VVLDRLPAALAWPCTALLLLLLAEALTRAGLPTSPLVDDVGGQDSRLLGLEWPVLGLVVLLGLQPARPLAAMTVAAITAAAWTGASSLPTAFATAIATASWMARLAWATAQGLGEGDVVSGPAVELAVRNVVACLAGLAAARAARAAWLGWGLRRAFHVYAVAAATIGAYLMAKGLCSALRLSPASSAAVYAAVDAIAAPLVANRFVALRSIWSAP